MSTRFNELKNSLSNKLRAAESQVIENRETTISDELVSNFQEIIEARDNAHRTFNDLYKERINIYDTFISLFYVHFYNNNIQRNAADMRYFIKLLQIIKTDEFVGAIESALKNSYNSVINGQSLLNFFESTYNELKEIFYPETDIVFTSGFNSLTIGSNSAITISNLSSQLNPDKILYILKFLYSSTSSSISLLSEYRDFLIGEKEGSAYYEILQDINKAKTQIEDSISSYLFIDAYRQKEDTGYYEDYIIDIKNLFNSLSEEIVKINDFSIEGLNFMEQVGQFNIIYSRLEELYSLANEVIYDGLLSIEKIEYFIEDYSPFVRMPSNEKQQLLNSIKEINEMNKKINEMNFDELNNSDFNLINPFPNEGQNALTKDFQEWNNELLELETKPINADIFNLILLRVGVILSRDTLSEKVAEELISFSLLRLYDRKLINENSINENFKIIKSVENGLLNKDIEVVRRYQDDNITFGFKDILPQLEVLDYMNFDEINDNDLEPDFGENVKTLILEAFLRNKKDLDNKILRTLDLLTDGSFKNAKSLYVKLRMNEVIQAFSTYLGDGSSQHNIQTETLESIKRYSDQTNIQGDLDHYLQV
jgi:hypothetical protein